MTLDFGAHIRTESDRFLDSLRGADPRATVPSCPDWDAADLLWHLTEVQAHWGLIVAGRAQSPEEVTTPDRPAGYASLVSAFAEWSEHLSSALEGVSDDVPVWTWARDHSVGFIRRRQAHEALIHRLDAELTIGEITPLPSALAADGVLEALDVMYGGCPPWGRFTTDGHGLAVVCTDTNDRFSVLLGRFVGTDPSDGTTYDEPDISVGALSSAPAATISGTAEDLDAWLWHRRGPEGVDFEGSEETLAAVRDILRQPIE